MKEFQKITEQMMERFESLTSIATPKVSFNKNGYEIRSNVLEMAKHQAWQDYEATVGMVGMKVKKEGDEVVTVITMPDVPGTEKILETAQAFYDFVNNSKPKA